MTEQTNKQDKVTLDEMISWARSEATRIDVWEQVCREGGNELHPDAAEKRRRAIAVIDTLEWLKRKYASTKRRAA